MCNLKSPTNVVALEILSHLRLEALPNVPSLPSSPSIPTTPIEKRLDKLDKFAWYSLTSALSRIYGDESCPKDAPIVLTLPQTNAVKDAVKRVIQAMEDGATSLSDMSVEEEELECEALSNAHTIEQSLQGKKRAKASDETSTRQSRLVIFIYCHCNC